MGEEKIKQLKNLLAERDATIAVLQPQIMKRECNYAQRQDVLHHENIGKCKAELVAVRETLVKVQTEVKRLQPALDSTIAQLATDRMQGTREHCSMPPKFLVLPWLPLSVHVTSSSRPSSG